MDQYDCKMVDQNWRKYTSPSGSQIAFLENYNGDANRLLWENGDAIKFDFYKVMLTKTLF